MNQILENIATKLSRGVNTPKTEVVSIDKNKATYKTIIPGLRNPEDCHSNEWFDDSCVPLIREALQGAKSKGMKSFDIEGNCNHIWILRINF